MQESSFLKNNERVLELLRSIDKFELFSNVDLQALLKQGKLKKYEPGEIIINEGDFDSWIFFLLTGEVEILKHQKRVKVFRRLGDIFGEMCVLDGQARSATIRAVQKTLLLGVDGSLMDHQLKAHDVTFCYTLYRLFAEVLAERLRITTEENSLLHKKIRQYEGES